MTSGYFYGTAKGQFFVILKEDGQWHAILDGDSYGAWSSAEGAIDDLSGGHVPCLPDGTNTDEIGLPDDIAEWHPLRG